MIPEDGEFVTLLLETRELEPSRCKINVERDLTKQELDTLELLFNKKKVGTEFESFDAFFAACPRICCNDVDKPRLKYDDPGLVCKKDVVTLPYVVKFAGKFFFVIFCFVYFFQYRHPKKSRIKSRIYF